MLALLAAACTDSPVGPGRTPATGRRDPSVVPALQREARGLWLATVANIDWPSRPGLAADRQRAELLSILDHAVGAGMNTIILQVRPAADAVYRSSLEPWGAMLTGTQGVDPGYDPLAFAVREAHRRGLELHAWINPFRAGNSADSSKLAASHVFHDRRDLVRVYGTQLWLDPGEPEVHDRSLRVVLDIVNRYDVDGIHLDDFFYPYPQSDASRRQIPFPDAATYSRYGAGIALADWRRANVNRFVERLYVEVHAAKPAVRVGISPFGIWRPGNPAQVTGLDAYSAIYADSRKWLQLGWVDYFVPQLYWRIDPPQQSFTALLDWWMSQNTRRRHLWPGVASYRVYSTSNAFTVGEIADQVAATRARGGSGVVFFNTTTTLTSGNGAIASMLQREFFTDPSIAPAAPWLGGAIPPPPTIVVEPSTNGTTLRLLPPSGTVRWWVVRYRAAGEWTTRVVFGDQRAVVLTAPSGAAVDWIVANGVSAEGAVSDDAVWRRALS
ncbi:MAG: family 10 glycosylhydrolase [Gemmatimonadaceae bacterium]